MTHYSNKQPLLQQNEAVSDFHTIAEVEWAAKYKKTGAQLIHFEITYLLQFVEKQPKILAYVSHEDQEKAMIEYGIL